MANGDVQTRQISFLLGSKDQVDEEHYVLCNERDYVLGFEDINTHAPRGFPKDTLRKVSPKVNGTEYLLISYYLGPAQINNYNELPSAARDAYL